MLDFQRILDTTSPYLRPYLMEVPGGNIIDILTTQLDTVPAFFQNIPEDRLMYAYEPGKWTPKDILLHLVDSERVFAYRAMRFARGDANDLAGFDENDYVPFAQANTRHLDTLVAEYVSVRTANLHLFRSFDEDALWRVGKASGALVSVYGLLYAIAGHELHHLAVIRERYLG